MPVSPHDSEYEFTFRLLCSVDLLRLKTKRNEEKYENDIDKPEKQKSKKWNILVLSHHDNSEN